MFIASKNEFKQFSSKYYISMPENDFVTLKFNEENFDKEMLMNSIKRLICKGYVKKNLVYQTETEYQEDEYTPGTPMIVKVYTEQECSDKRFLKDLNTFVVKIIDIYNNIAEPEVDDMLGFIATYTVEFPGTDYDDSITYYAFLSIEDVYEENGIVYVTFGLW